jgi:hypothetical protein
VKQRFSIHWGASTARERGAIIGTVSRPHDRNVIGTHGGSYALYRALAVSAGALENMPAVCSNSARRRPIHEIQDALAAGRLLNDGDVVHNNGGVSVV